MGTAVHPLPPVIMSGTLNILAGAPGCGKTALVASLMKAFHDGQVVLGRQPATLPGFGVVVTDRSWDSTGRWYQTVGYSNIPYYSLIDDADFNPRRDLRANRTELLRRCLQRLQLPPGSLVTIDPIALFLGGTLNDYDRCATHCIEIRRLAVEFGFTLIGLTHSGKQKSDKKERYLRLQDRTLGSTAILGYADTQMYLAAPEELDQPYYGFHVQSHHAAGETHLLDRDDDGRFIPYTPEKHEKDFGSILLLFPQDGTPIKFADLIERAASIPMSRMSLFRALRQLQEQGIVERVAHGWWRKRPAQ